MTMIAGADANNTDLTEQLAIYQQFPGEIIQYFMSNGEERKYVLE